MMKINDFVSALQIKLNETAPNFGDDADSVLGFLCGAYYDQNCNSDSEEIKQAFEDLYEAMAGSHFVSFDTAVLPYKDSYY